MKRRRIPSLPPESLLSMPTEQLKPLLIVFIVGQVVLLVWTILERQK